MKYTITLKSGFVFEIKTQTDGFKNLEGESVSYFEAFLTWMRTGQVREIVLFQGLKKIIHWGEVATVDEAEK